jgi:hypothetical protein
MGAVELRQDLHQLIDQLDERFLKAVHSMVIVYQESSDADQIAGYDIDGTPRTTSELTAILEAQVAAGLKGEYITVEDLRKQSNQWLGAIK